MKIYLVFLVGLLNIISCKTHNKLSGEFTYRTLPGRVEIQDTSTHSYLYDTAFSIYLDSVNNSFGEPPPDPFELMKLFMCTGYPDTIRGWATDIKDVLKSGSGDVGYIICDATLKCTNKINGYLPLYVYRIAYSWGNGDELRVYTTDEEKERRSSVIK